MANLLQSDVVLSSFGTRIFMVGANLKFEEAFTPGDTDEIIDVIGVENLGFSRDSQDYNILANGGWPKKSLGAFTTDDMTLNLVRSEQGAYNYGSTYHRFYEKLEQFKANKAFFGIIIATPTVSVGEDDAYEAKYWTCFCNGVDEGATGDSGREYTVSLARSGKPTYLEVAHDEATDKFTFTLRKKEEAGA